ncbi:pentapeptide repeat-containing protein [Nodularia harveyana UHCC-0300]|uniref:Pentapeptide repeat-containing protein n=1 Tax=Nodularia harveyana UHCC-0300 TaxID=2974287 RepID=A0ABU5UGM9_9CYAN|nr:pentapeptide repeat-containing protein [Nodularia harveyana]MEA5582141.1 pentapeptide repeat-containing protein [Nodularia harveyana UHCC-0300]
MTKYQEFFLNKITFLDKKRVWIYSSLGFIFFVWLGFFLSYEEPRIDNFYKLDSDSKILQDMRKRFKEARSIPDPLKREFKLHQDSKELDILFYDYKNFYNIYRRNAQPLPDYPENKFSILMWRQWWFQDVSSDKRLEIFRNGFFFVLQQGFIFTGIFTLVKYLKDEPTRRKQEQYQSWQMIHMANGQKGSSARLQAIEDLNKNGLSLQGLPVENADLEGINLEKANLKFANFRLANLSNAILIKANLSGAIFRGTQLVNAKLHEAKVSGTDLRGANLSMAEFQRCTFTSTTLADSNISGTDFSDAQFDNTHFSNSYLIQANFSKTILFRVTFCQANLLKANFTGAIFKEVDLTDSILWETNLCDADLFNVKGLTFDQIKSAIGNTKTKLPENIKRPENWI